MDYSDYKIQNSITILFILLGFILVLLQAYNYNLGVTSDGVNYIEVARNIMKGNGIVNDNGNFVNHWPPLYALTLAGFSKLLNLEPFLSGKYLNAILLGLTFWFFNKILSLQHTTNKARIVLNFLLLFSVSVNIYTWFLSEPLFITILMIAIYFFKKWTLLGKPHFLILSGVTFGFLILIRYAGIGFLSGLLFYLFITKKESILRRVRNSLLLITSTAPIILAWFLYSTERTGNIANRTFSFHPIPFRKILSFGKTLLSWIIPFKNELLLGITGILLLGFFLYLVSRIPNFKKYLQILGRVSKNYLYIFGFMIVSYLLFIVFSISFMDADISLDGRILAPIFPLLLLTILPFIEFYLRKPYKHNAINFFFIFTLILFISTSTLSCFSAINEGQGITSKKFKNSTTLKMIPQFFDKKIYTNDTNYISLYFPEHSTQVHTIPKWLNSGNLNKSEDLDIEIFKMKASILNDEAVLVYFNTVNWKEYLIDSDEILKLFTDRTIINTDDGFIIK